MHQTKKDSRSKLIRSVAATAANVADSKVLPDLLHGDENWAWGDQAYRGQREAIRKAAPRAKDFTNRRYRHKGVVDETERTKNGTKSQVRAKVEHPFLVQGGKDSVDSFIDTQHNIPI
jgi:IS5 family transposase